MKIAIEGMDGVGKTTVAKMVANKEKFLYIDKPLHYFFDDTEENGYADLMRMADKVYDIDDPVIRSWFIGMGNILCFKKFEKKDFIVDRHFVSNYFWNGSAESDEVFKAMINIIGVPDLTILLYATPKTRMNRIKIRNPNDKDIFDSEKQVDGYDKMLNFINQFSIPYLMVNTEKKTVNQVVDEILIKIDEIRENQKDEDTLEKKLIKK